MYYRKKVLERKGFWVLLLVMVTALFITGSVFADGELPVDGAQGSGSDVQNDAEVENDADLNYEVITISQDLGLVIEESDYDSSTAEVEEADQNTDESVSEDGEYSAGASDEDEPPPDPENASEPLSDEELTEEPINEIEFATEELMEDNSEIQEDCEESGENDSLAEIPEELEVELVDNEGNSLELGIEENADLLSGSDPRWIYGGLWYSVVTDEGFCYEGTSVAEGTCWVSTTPISTALEKIEEGRLPSDGLLIVEAGTYNEGTLNIAGTNLSQLKGLIGAGSSTTTIIGDVSLTVNKGFTLSGFTITGGIEVWNSSGTLSFSDLNVSNPDGDGLYVDGFDGVNVVPHPSPISMTNVDFNENSSVGAKINSKSTVSISNANFNGNGGVGLDISTTSKVTLTGVTAKDNIGNGVQVFDFNYLTAKHIIANNNAFEHPEYASGYGLLVLSNAKSKVILENIQANENLLNGVLVSTIGPVSVKIIEASSNDESGVVIFTNAAVSIESVVTENNVNDGVAVYSGNKVSLASIVSNSNGLKGLRVDALVIGYYDDVLDEWITTGVFYPTSVTLASSKTGGLATPNSFAGNGEEGLAVFAKGTVTLSNFDSFDNGGAGIYIDNYLYDEGTDLILGKGNVTISVSIPNWTNGLWNNNGDGLFILSNGVVSITRTSANENLQNGIYVDSSKTIKLNTTSANQNNKSGAFLTNLAATRAQSVFINDSSFDANNDTGLVVLSYGTINASGTSAADNLSPTLGGPISMPVSIFDFLIGTDGSENWGFYGTTGQQLDIILESNDFDAVVTIYNSAESWSLSDDNSYGGTNAHIYTGLPADDWYRIEVTYNGSLEGQGDYTLSVNDEAHDYYVFPGSGARLDNSGGKSSVLVSTSKTNPESNFDGNAGMGLHVQTSGGITLKGIGADNNYRTGLLMDNPQSNGKVSFTDKAKTLTGTFNNNGWSGIYLRTMGAVNLLGISSIGENGDTGLNIDNCLFDEGTGLCLGKGSVTLKSINAEGNGGAGIQVISFSTINLSTVVSNNNYNIGVYLNNQMPFSLASVILKDVTAAANNNTGISINTYGNVTLSDMVVLDNFKTSGYLSVGDAVHEYYNDGVGVDRWTFYAENGVELQFQLFETDNGEWKIDNFYGTLQLYDAEGNPIAFTFSTGTGTSTFAATWTPSESGFYYLEVGEEESRDGFYRLSINNGSFDNMTYIFVDGASIAAGKNVTVSGKNLNYFNHNSLVGLYIETIGNIKLQNIRTSNNGTEGTYLDNYAEGAGTGSITVSGANNLNRSIFSGNGWDGLVITTNGLVNTNYLLSMYNNLAGIDIWGESKMSAKNVDVMFNGESGLLVNCVGLISLINVNAVGNNKNGIDLVNGDGVKFNGQSNILDNGEDGIHIQTNGSTTLMGVDARRNGRYGIYVDSQGDGAISLTKNYVSSSGDHGIYLKGNAAISLNTVTSFNNGEGSEGDGIYIECWTPANTNLTFRNSVFMGNEGNGIEIQAFGTDLASLSEISMINFGNDTNDTGDPNELYEVNY